MPDQQQSSIKFTLEESVLFQSGQEVDELISISLDPKISISEEDDFVFLRGHLGLTGEYKPVKSGDEEHQPSDDIGNFIQVHEREEGDFVFSHQFPVDITIPKQRVANVDELFVEVENFDYELPENSRLKIVTEVLVYGLHDSQAENQILEEGGDQTERLPYVDKHEEQSDMEEENDESAVEIQLHHAEEDVPESVDRDGSADEDGHKPAESDSLFEPFTAEARSISDSNEPPAHYQHHPSFPFPFPVLPEMDIDEMAMRAKKFFKEMEENAESSSYPADSPQIIEETSSYESSSHESDDTEEPESEEKPKKKKGKYQTMSFADFFARKEEEPAKIKVCLVQQGDSIERLADKYEVSVQQILRANKLDSAHELDEGQVLYIPEKTAYRK